ncbi:hypothetical protein GCM10029978_004010 [Actinoallomurus acanthiterrae]
MEGIAVRSGASEQAIYRRYGSEALQDEDFSKGEALQDEDFTRLVTEAHIARRRDAVRRARCSPTRQVRGQCDRHGVPMHFAYRWITEVERSG